MRTVIASVAIIAALTGHPAFAEEASSQQPTRIEIDQAAKTFIFIIDDKPIALLDKSGLAVREGIIYGATLMDADKAQFDRTIESLSKEAADD